MSPAEINYGQTLADVTITGGECWYVDPDTGEETLVPGHFEVRSTTTKPAINEAYSLQLKFVSDDTTQYSNISTLLATSTTIKSGTWPAIKVNGLDGTLVSAPTAATIQEGQRLSEATLSGGVVNDAEGNPVSGAWAYVEPLIYPRESGKYEIQFRATGYNVLKTTIDVTVTPGAKVTVAESPLTKRVVVGGKLSAATLSGGKVVDENGTEITTGRWSLINDDTQDTSTVLDTLGTFTYKAQWVAVGYEIITADVSVLVAADKGYTVDAPTLESPVPWVTDLTYGTLPFVYGNASVPGTYTISNSATAIPANKNVTNSASVTFTPDDPTLGSTSWSYSFKIKYNDVWYTQPEEPPKIVVSYGFSGNSVSKGSSVSWPDYLVEQGVFIFQWSKDNFDASTLEVGDIQLVSGNMNSGKGTGYSNVPAQAYIQIQPGVYSGDFGSFMITVDMFTQKCNITYSCSIPGITGTVTIKQGDTVLGTLTPDENGKIRQLLHFTPGKDGSYAFTATYTPGDMDKVTIANPVLTSKTFDLDIKNPIKYFVYDSKGRVDENSSYGGSETWVSFGDSGYNSEDVEYWEVVDQNGKPITVYDAQGNPAKLDSGTVYFMLPEDESITELHFYPHGPWDDNIIIGGGDTGDGIFGGICSFFQKIIDWFTNMIKQMMSIFGLGA